MAVVLGECDPKCLLGPGNTDVAKSEIDLKIFLSQRGAESFSCFCPCTNFALATTEGNCDSRGQQRG